MSNESEFMFEGERLPLSKICERVPRLSKFTIRKYLKRGMTTRTQMLSVPHKGKKRSQKRRKFLVGNGS